VLITVPQPSAVVASKNTGKLERLAAMNDTVVTQLNTLCSKAPDPAPRTALAVGLTKALCHIMTSRARASRESDAVDTSSASGERVVVISATGELHDQYIPTMNCIFAAQKEEIMVDTCLLEGSSALLQQAAALTGGVYTEVSPAQLPDLLHHLIAVLLPDRDDRQLLQLPVNKLVDYRAACFCHGRAIDQFGFVCSDCFSGELGIWAFIRKDSMRVMRPA
jgi:transcription initiation factor TFIIH subunit 3